MPPPIPAADLLARLQRNEAVAGETISDDVTIGPASFSQGVSIRNCVFQGSFSAADARFGRSVDLSGCQFRGAVSFAGARVEGHLVLDGAVIDGAVPAAPAANFRLLRVDGDLCARSLKSQVKLDFSGVQVGGDLDCSSRPAIGAHTACEGDVCLHNARVSGQVRFRGVDISGGLSLDLAVLGGRVECGPLTDPPEPLSGGTVLRTTTIDGRVSLQGCKVSGLVDFRGASIAHGKHVRPGRDRGLELESAEVKGGLFCRSVQGRRTRIGQGVGFSAAAISGSADFAGADIDGEVCGEGAVISGPLFFNRGEPCRRTAAPAAAGVLDEYHPTKISGPVRLSTLKASSVLECRGAWLAQGLELWSAVIEKGLGCGEWTDPPPAAGPGGAPAKPAPVEVGGLVNLSGARVSGPVDFGGARLGFPVDLTRDDPAAPRPGAAPPPVAPPVTDGLSLRADGLRVAGDVILIGSRLREGLDLHGADITGDLLWAAPAPDAGLAPTVIGGRVNFEGCSVQTAVLSNVQFTGKEDQGRILLQGFRFRDLQVEGDDYCGFLQRSRFRKSAYVAVEQWLKDRADNGAAAAVYVAMRRRDRAEGVAFTTWVAGRAAALARRLGAPATPVPVDGKGMEGMGPLARVADWVVDKTTLYGLQTWRPAVILLPMFVLTFLLFRDARALTAVPDKGADPAKAQGGEQRHPAQAEWGAYDALLMTFRLHFPGLSFATSDRWKPSAEPLPWLGWPGYSGWAFGVSVLSPALFSLFGAGIASIVRKPKEEKGRVE
jgi:uncharacterized protein YjbI with pentapeptide repeats